MNTLRIVEIDYTNHRGDRRKRRIRPLKLEFTNNEYHVAQWLITAVDIERDATRTFACQYIHSWKPSPEAKRKRIRVDEPLDYTPRSDLHGRVVNKADRNSGFSWGLNHPYLYGGLFGAHCVWHRKDGVIVFAAGKHVTLDELFAADAAKNESERLNALLAGYESGKLPIDIAAIDSTP